MYESLLTYVAHMDLVGDPLQDTCHARVSKILFTKIRKILYVGGVTYLDLQAITRCEWL